MPGSQGAGWGLDGVMGAQMTLTSLMGWTEMRSAVYSLQGLVQQMSIFYGDSVLMSAEIDGFDSLGEPPYCPSSSVVSSVVPRGRLVKLDSTSSLRRGRSQSSALTSPICQVALRCT